MERMFTTFSLLRIVAELKIWKSLGACVYTNEQIPPLLSLALVNQVQPLLPFTYLMEKFIALKLQLAQKRFLN